MSDFVQLLVEMGFPKDKAETAVSATGNKGVEPAMEWLLTNGDNDTSSKLVEAEQKAEKPGETSEEVNEPSTSGKTSDDVVRSYKCEECGALFKNAEMMEYHAAKTNHTNFSESTEEKKPLTPEEKEEQLKRIEEKLKQKRAEREEREKKDAVEQEKLRVKSGKDMLEAKRRFEEQEMKAIAEARRKEKIDDQRARERVKAQIEADKAARREKYGMPAPATTSATNGSPAVSSTKVETEKDATPAPKKEYKQTKLQMKLPNGKTLTQTFGSNEPLAAVRLYIEINRDDGLVGGFNLMTSFPKKVFTGDEYDIPLEALGLVPSAVLMVTKSA